MPRLLLRAIFAKLARDTGAVAMVEFAIAAPLLIILYLGGYVMSDAVACNRKVTIATRELTDLVTRYPAVSTGTMTTLMAASTQVLAPYNASNATLTIKEVQIIGNSASNNAQVIWTCTYNGTAPGQSAGSATCTQPTAGTVLVTVPNAMLSPNMYPSTNPTVTGAFFILGNISYNYRPAVSFNGFTQMTMQDQMYMIPRLSNQVPLQ